MLSDVQLAEAGEIEDPLLSACEKLLVMLAIMLRNFSSSLPRADRENARAAAQNVVADTLMIRRCVRSVVTVA